MSKHRKQKGKGIRGKKQGGQVGFFSAQNHNVGFFRGPLAFFIFRKKAHEIGLFLAFFGVDRILLKFYLHSTNFNLFFDTFLTFLDNKNHNKAI